MVGPQPGAVCRRSDNEQDALQQWLRWAPSCPWYARARTSMHAYEGMHHAEFEFSPIHTDMAVPGCPYARTCATVGVLQRDGWEAQ